MDIVVEEPKQLGFDLSVSTELLPRLTKLQQFIMQYPGETIAIEDILNSFWADTEELEAMVASSEKTAVGKRAKRDTLSRATHKEQRKVLTNEARTLVDDCKPIVAKIKQRRERVRLAFNQLLLAGKVLMPVKTHIDGAEVILWQSFEEYRLEAIASCKKEIITFKAFLEEDKREGRDNLFTQCWYSNLHDYLESYEQTEVMQTSKMSDLLKSAYKPKAELLCVGSELVMGVYPVTIKLRGCYCQIGG